MTSMPYTPQGEGEDRHAKRRQAVEKARGRMRHANGKDGNGLRDAARRISESARARADERSAPQARPENRGPVEPIRTTGSKADAAVQPPR